MERQEEEGRKSIEEEEEEKGSGDEEEEVVLGEEEEKGSGDEEEEEDKGSGEEEEEEEEEEKVLGEEEEEDTRFSQRTEEKEELDSAADEDDEDEDEEEHKEKAAAALKKSWLQTPKVVPGIIYVGHVPPKLRPKHMRNMLSVFGEIGRVFLQPEDHFVKRMKKKSGLRRCDFTEGWVEFRDKRVAKKVAASLHNTPMANRKRSRFAADLWSIKYLHRFQWTHLSEQLAYQRTVQQQRLRTEVSQAKKETNFYLDNVDKSSHMEKNKKRRRKQGLEEKSWDFTQRQTEEEIQLRKKKRKDGASQKQLEKSRLLQQKSQSNVSLLSKIFNAGQ